jgi:valyl-tRNA synthetase
MDIGAERLRLQAELAEVEGQIARLEKLLAGDFSQKAPATVVDRERQRLADYQEAKVKLARQIEAMG